jgi:hypothetical protein
MSDMNRAILKMVGEMKKDYQRFWTRADGSQISEFAQSQLDGFMESIEIQQGKKYIKIVRNDGQSMVWGFIVNTDTDKKFKRGDILKAAGWAAPARNKARGNVFSDLSWVRWTGPAYL